jgi:hypothetical protein
MREYLVTKKRGRPRLGPLTKWGREVIRDASKKPRGRPSSIPRILMPYVMDMVALTMAMSEKSGRKTTVGRAVRLVVDALTEDMAPEVLAFICEAAKVDYPGRGRLAHHRRKTLAENWLVSVNVEIKRLYFHGVK